MSNPLTKLITRIKEARQAYNVAFYRQRAKETYYLGDYTDARGVLHGVIFCKGEVVQYCDNMPYSEYLTKLNELRNEYVNKKTS